MNFKQVYDLEDRLITFVCQCLDVYELLPNTKAGNNLEYQLSKSCTATALIYGEAQAAESRSDFLHKMKLVLKEYGKHGLIFESFIKNQLFKILKLI